MLRLVILSGKDFDGEAWFTVKDYTSTLSQMISSEADLVILTSCSSVHLLCS